MTIPHDQKRYMPGVDGLRAIAVLAVFFYHTNTGGWMPGGFLGVDVFFVISGYLITSILLSEYRRTGHLKVLRFWLRRARRLLPAVGVFIAVTILVAAILVPEDVSSLRGDAVASLFYVNNWHLLFTDQSYFEAFARPSLFRHLWSLSVEEQFYLLWPLFFAAGMTLFGRRRLLYGVIAGALASALLMAILFDPHVDAARVFYGTDTRAVGLLMGVALAMVWHPADLRAEAGRGARWILDAAGLLALVMVLASFLRVNDFDASLYRGGFLLLAAWTTLLVAVLAHPAARLGSVVGNKPLVWLGLRSYSFYLWHWPVLMLSRPGIDVSLHGPVLVILQLGLTLLLADLSYRYVEEPFRQREGSPSAPPWLRRGRVALAAGVAASVLLVGWSGIVSTESSDLASARLASAGAPDASDSAVRGELAGQGPEGSNGSGQDGAVPHGKGAGGDLPPTLAIGDSVMHGAADTLNSDFGGRIVVDAKESRQPWDFAPVAEAHRSAGLPEDVVVHVGNNGPVYYDELDDLRQALEGVDHVYLVNVLVPRSWQDEVNAELSSFVSEWPEATVVDWHGAAAGDDDLTYDGIHLTPEGETAYTRAIEDAVRSG
jgi:peptidoglycan/LPS O-acetylase OafA/YrhL